jgi:hypothetical protein
MRHHSCGMKWCVVALCLLGAVCCAAALNLSDLLHDPVEAQRQSINRIGNLTSYSGTLLLTKTPHEAPAFIRCLCTPCLMYPLSLFTMFRIIYRKCNVRLLATVIIGFCVL